MALGLGLMALILLTLVRADLLDNWRKGLPADAPNRFLVNIQPDQVQADLAILRRQWRACARVVSDGARPSGGNKRQAGVVAGLCG